MNVKAIIAGALVAIIALCALGIGIGMTNQDEVKVPTSHMLEYHGFTNQEQLPTNASEALQMGGEHLSGRLEVLGYEQGTPVLIPEEEQLTTLPQSYTPTCNYVEGGEIIYTGWKVVRDDPVVEEPEKPQRPTVGCPHGYINPVFCWKCNP